MQLYFSNQRQVKKNQTKRILTEIKSTKTNKFCELKQKIPNYLLMKPMKPMKRHELIESLPKCMFVSDKMHKMPLSLCLRINLC